jgi:hypothetical protein
LKNLKFLILSILFFSCKPKIETENYGFYYWKSIFKLNATEKKLLENSLNPNLYLRLYDLDKNENNLQILGKVKIQKPINFHKNIVPVIFITNRTWFDAEENFIHKVANQIKNNVLDFEIKYKKQITEIQIDCDWTSQTQKEYFEFLDILKSLSKKKITCTLRLHQVKDKQQTGIPKVNKVYLMCYATSSPLDNSNANSILEVNLLKNYLHNLQDYPLKMDIALPIYSWGIVTNHLGKKKLINALEEKDLQNRNFQKIDKNKYKILTDGFYFGMYLSEGFIIKIENISPKQLTEVKQFINTKINYKPNYIYYHLNSNFTKNFPNIFQ